jgi:hypothetical protein
LVRHQFLELGVLLLQRIEPLERLLLGPAVFLPPAVAGRRAALQLLADLLDALACGQQRRRLAQLLDDLFGAGVVCVSW